MWMMDAMQWEEGCVSVGVEEPEAEGLRRLGCCFVVDLT